MLWRPIEDRRMSHIDAPIIGTKALTKRFGVFTAVDQFSLKVRDLMPDWLEIISLANPLTYEVDALRTLMLVDGTSKFRLGVDLAVLVSVAAVFIAIAAHLHPPITA
jgi:hypothetical protein